MADITQYILSYSKTNYTTHHYCLAFLTLYWSGIQQTCVKREMRPVVLLNRITKCKKKQNSLHIFCTNVDINLNRRHKHFLTEIKKIKSTNEIKTWISLLLCSFPLAFCVKTAATPFSVNGEGWHFAPVNTSKAWHLNIQHPERGPLITIISNIVTTEHVVKTPEKYKK